MGSREPAPRRVLAGGALATAVARAIGLASLGLASIVLARALGPDGYGTFAVAFSIQWILAALASLGLANGIGYEVATGRWQPGSALRHGVAGSIALGLVGAAGGAVVIAAAGDSTLPDVSTAAIVVLMAGVPLGVAVVVLVGIAIALERYEAAAVMLAGQPIAVAALAAAATIHYGVSATVAAIGIAVVTTGIASVIWALRLASKLDRESDAKPRPARLREAIRFGAQTWAADLFSLLNLRADLILIGALAGAQEAGLYAVATTVVSLGLIVPHAFAQVLLPRIGALDQEAGTAGAAAAIRPAGRHAVLVAATTSIALILLVLLIPAFYGAGFEDSVVLGLVLVPGVAALGVSRVLGYMLAGLGEPGVLLRLLAAVVIPTLVAYVVVIPWAEAMGAAIVSTTSYGAILVVTLVALCHRADVSATSLLVPRRGDLAAYAELVAAIGPRARLRRGGHGTPPG